MKHLLWIVLSVALVGLTAPVLGQRKERDSLIRELARPQTDTSRALLLAGMADNYRSFKADSAWLIAQHALQLAEKAHFIKGQGRAWRVLGIIYREKADLPGAFSALNKALALNRASQDRQGEINTLRWIGIVYADLGEFRKAIEFNRKAYEMSYTNPDKSSGSSVSALQIIGNLYEEMNMLDTAMFYRIQVYQLVKRGEGPPAALAGILRDIGHLHARSGNRAKALAYYRRALQIVTPEDNFRTQSTIEYRMAELFYENNQSDSSFHYAYRAQRNLHRANVIRYEFLLNDLLTQLYFREHQLDSAFHYQQVQMALMEERYGLTKFQEIQKLLLAEQQRQQAQEAAQKEYQSRVQLYALLAGLVVVVLISFLLYRSNRQKHQSNKMLLQKNQKIESTLTELRATQTQLIQKEKMASLGELTAGIAHEIQNPLNFVNNFSEVSTELMDELEQEADAGNTSEIKAIALDLRDNLQKIHHHGRRADAIVRGMLEHARTTPGEREPTDLNALADEYLRLAYQGLRAKDNGFQCELITDYDANIGEVELVASDIGRVLLNLYNNALYAVQQKRLVMADQAYVPRVWVSTKRLNGSVEIKVRDNGPGIPETIRDKIFQPFFTTKPTGEGTGLGLSLSYDIVTKGHGGTLSVASVENAFTEFLVTLPAS